MLKGSVTNYPPTFKVCSIGQHLRHSPKAVPGGGLGTEVRDTGGRMFTLVN